MYYTSIQICSDSDLPAFAVLDYYHMGGTSIPPFVLGRTFYDDERVVMSMFYGWPHLAPRHRPKVGPMGMVTTGTVHVQVCFMWRPWLDMRPRNPKVVACQK